MLEPESCVLFSTADWDAPYWTNKQHTAALLGKRGTQVLYVESVGLRAPSASSGKDWSRLGRRLVTGLRSLLMGPRHVQANVWVLSPLVIPFKHDHAWVRWFNQNLMQLQIRLFLGFRKLKKPLIWTYHPFMLDVLEGMSTGKLVYHCVDDLSAVPGIDATAYKAEEQKLLKQADVVFATAPALAEHCAKYNANTHFLANVVDIEHFGRAQLSGAEPVEIAEIPRPRIGYVGALSDYKVDFELIRAVAEARTDWHWVIIGSEREGQYSTQMNGLKALTNVHFLGDKPYASLPDYLRAFNVATLPTLINDYTRSMFPMKYFEYLAAGVPVVSTPLEFTKDYQGGLLIAADAGSFEKAILQQLGRGRFNLEESERLVGDNTWLKRLQKMIKIIDNKYE